MNWILSAVSVVAVACERLLVMVQAYFARSELPIGLGVHLGAFGDLVDELFFVAQGETDKSQIG